MTNNTSDFEKDMANTDASVMETAAHTSPRGSPSLAPLANSSLTSPEDSIKVNEHDIPASDIDLSMPKPVLTLKERTESKSDSDGLTPDPDRATTNSRSTRESGDPVPDINASHSDWPIIDGNGRKQKVDPFKTHLQISPGLTDTINAEGNVSDTASDKALTVKTFQKSPATTKLLSKPSASTPKVAKAVASKALAVEYASESTATPTPVLDIDTHMTEAGIDTTDGTLTTTDRDNMAEARKLSPSPVSGVVPDLDVPMVDPPRSLTGGTNLAEPYASTSNLLPRENNASTNDDDPAEDEPIPDPLSGEHNAYNQNRGMMETPGPVDAVKTLPDGGRDTSVLRQSNKYFIRNVAVRNKNGEVEEREEVVINAWNLEHRTSGPM